MEKYLPIVFAILALGIIISLVLLMHKVSMQQSTLDVLSSKESKLKKQLSSVQKVDDSKKLQLLTDATNESVQAGLLAKDSSMDLKALVAKYYTPDGTLQGPGVVFAYDLSVGWDAVLYFLPAQNITQARIGILTLGNIFSGAQKMSWSVSPNPVSSYLKASS